MPRSLLAALVAALAAIMPAAASAQDGPTLTFDKPCYSPGDRIVLTGTGFAPGSVELAFSSMSTLRLVGSVDIAADAAGAIDGSFSTPDPDKVLKDSEFSGMVGVATGGTPDRPFAGAAFRLSRFEVEIERPAGGPLRAAKPMSVTAVGYTHAIGRMLYLHYVRGSRRVKTIKVGRLTGDCGDRRRVLVRALPRSLRPGRYRLVFNASALNAPREPGYGFKLRLR